MDSGDILLGRPCMHDKNETHGMRSNTYTFAHMPFSHFVKELDMGSSFVFIPVLNFLDLGRLLVENEASSV